MKDLDIVVMGKTGAGKSTLINSILGEERAKTGSGCAVTQTNQIYEKKMGLIDSDGYHEYNVQLCDTVGLEIDTSITDRTLNEIRSHIEEAKKESTPDSIHLVWFCVNNNGNRFEPYEIDLIRKLSIDYEIPFIIVITQCLSDEEGELEKKIKDNLGKIPRKRVLAKDYLMRTGRVPAFGVTDLLNESAKSYRNLKIEILERKIDELDTYRSERIQRIKTDSSNIIENAVDEARKISLVPGACIPFVHGICIKMVSDLNKVAGFTYGNRDLATEVVADALFSLVMTIGMIIPAVSIGVASTYVRQVGEDYLKTMLKIIDLSSDRELKDGTLVKQRLTKELKELKWGKK